MPQRLKAVGFKRYTAQLARPSFFYQHKTVMKIIRGFNNTPESARGCVVTLGNYDGVHRGHQTVLARLAEKAKHLAAPLVVMCFEPTPREFFEGDKAPARLSNFREKAQLLAAQGIDYLLLQRFSKRFAGLSAEAFIQQVLVAKLAVKAVVVGDDFRFGAGRQGDVAMLRQMGAQYGFEVLDTQTVATDNARISSTAVREKLAAGELAAAEELLGRPYSIEGRVIHGDKIGRQLGFPTANIAFSRHRLPLLGVYAVRLWNVAGCAEPLQAVANLGTRPAVNGLELRLEVHVLNWQGDLYGQRLRVEFVEFIRAEQKFDGLEALKAAIADDIQRASDIFN